MRASKPHCLRSLHACFKTSLDVFPLTFVPSRQDKMQLPRKGAQPQRQLLQGERCLTKLPHTPTTRHTEVCLSWARFGVATAERVLARTRATAEPWRMLAAFHRDAHAETHEDSHKDASENEDRVGIGKVSRVNDAGAGARNVREPGAELTVLLHHFEDRSHSGT